MRSLPPMTRLTIRLPDALLETIRSEAADEGRSVSNTVLRILKLKYGFANTPKLPLKKNPKLKLS
jgi:plasmid stability protein